MKSFDDGGEYAGEWKDGKFHGRGVAILNDGGVF